MSASAWNAETEYLKVVHESAISDASREKFAHFINISIRKLLTKLSHYVTHLYCIIYPSQCASLQGHLIKIFIQIYHVLYYGHQAESSRKVQEKQRAYERYKNKQLWQSVIFDTNTKYLSGNSGNGSLETCIHTNCANTKTAAKNDHLTPFIEVRTRESRRQGSVHDNGGRTNGCVFH